MRHAGHDLAADDRDPDGTWRRVHLGAVTEDDTGVAVQRHQLEVAGLDGALRRASEQLLCWDVATEVLVSAP